MVLLITWVGMVICNQVAKLPHGSWFALVATVYEVVSCGLAHRNRTGVLHIVTKEKYHKHGHVYIIYVFDLMQPTKMWCSNARA
jgi:hypothetical protein